MYNPGVSGFNGGRSGAGSWLQRITTRVEGMAHMANLVGVLGVLGVLFCLLALPSSQYWNLRLPIYLVLVIWTILRPRVALYLTPLAVPWSSLDTANLGGLHLSDILVFLLAASWLMSIVLRPLVAREDICSGPLDRAGFNVPRYLVLAVSALVLAMLVSMTAASSLSLSIKELVKWLEVLVIVLFGSQYIHTRRQIWTLVVIICVAAISQALLGYIQYFLHLGPASFIRSDSLRVYGTFDQPNPYAGYINMVLTIAIALLLLAKTLITRLLAGMTALLLGGVELLSQSKGGWIALGVAFVFILTISFPQFRILMKAAGMVALSLVGVYLAGLLPARLFTPLLQKIGLIDISFTYPTNDNYANSERMAHWLAGIHMFQDHPFLGVGIGNYEVAYPHYALGVFVLPLGHAHNYYINIAAEAGIFGFLGLLFFLLAAFIAGGRAYRAISKLWAELKTQRSRPQTGITTLQADEGWKRLHMLTDDRALVIGLLAALLSVCVHNLVDNLYVHSMTNLFALLLIMVIRLEGITVKRQ